MTNKETIKAKINPTNNTAHSSIVQENPALMNLMVPQPSSTGIDSMNENSAATVLLKPNHKDPMMVAPLLEVPGMIAKVWKAPMANAWG